MNLYTGIEIEAMLESLFAMIGGSFLDPDLEEMRGLRSPQFLISDVTDGDVTNWLTLEQAQESASQITIENLLIITCDDEFGHEAYYEEVSAQ